MGGSPLQRPVPPRLAAAILFLVVAGGVGIGTVVILKPWKKYSDGNAGSVEEGPFPGPKEPLAVGDAFPPLEAEGWLNARPPVWKKGEAKLVVVDLWAFW